MIGHANHAVVEQLSSLVRRLQSGGLRYCGFVSLLNASPVCGAVEAQDRNDHVCGCCRQKREAECSAEFRARQQMRQRLLQTDPGAPYLKTPVVGQPISESTVQRIAGEWIKHGPRRRCFERKNRVSAHHPTKGGAMLLHQRIKIFQSKPVTIEKARRRGGGETSSQRSAWTVHAHHVGELLRSRRNLGRRHLAYRL